MARKKTVSVEQTAGVTEQASGHVANITIEPEAEQPQLAAAPMNPAIDSDGPREEPPKNWGPPYKAIFTCSDQGFELGENRRYKQRVFLFADKPSPEILAELKDNGFTYRGEEKSWTVPATAESRKVSDELARKWAGPSYVQGMER